MLWPDRPHNPLHQQVARSTHTTPLFSLCPLSYTHTHTYVQHARDKIKNDLGRIITLPPAPLPLQPAIGTTTPMREPAWIPVANAEHIERSNVITDGGGGRGALGSQPDSTDGNNQIARGACAQDGRGERREDLMRAR